MRCHIPPYGTSQKHCKSNIQHPLTIRGGDQERKPGVWKMEGVENSSWLIYEWKNDKSAYFPPVISPVTSVQVASQVEVRGFHELQTKRTVCGEFTRLWVCVLVCFSEYFVSDQFELLRYVNRELLLYQVGIWVFYIHQWSYWSRWYQSRADLDLFLFHHVRSGSNRGKGSV